MVTRVPCPGSDSSTTLPRSDSAAAATFARPLPSPTSSDGRAVVNPGVNSRAWSAFRSSSSGRRAGSSPRRMALVRTASQSTPRPSSSTTRRRRC